MTDYLFLLNNASPSLSLSKWYSFAIVIRFASRLHARLASSAPAIRLPNPNIKMTSDRPPRNNKAVPKNSEIKNFVRYFRYFALFTSSIILKYNVCFNYHSRDDNTIIIYYNPKKRMQTGVIKFTDRDVCVSRPLV
jgi:hypothetical protein